MRTTLFFLCVLLTGAACTEEEKKTYSVKYEVLTEDKGWFGEYIIETGEKLCKCAPPLNPGGWTYEFNVRETPFTLHIDATSEVCPCHAGDTPPDVTTNIYVDGELVATNTSNWAPGLASADFVIE